MSSEKCSRRKNDGADFFNLNETRAQDTYTIVRVRNKNIEEEMMSKELSFGVVRAS